MSAQQSEDISLQRVLSHKLIRSPSRRFTVIGPDSRENLELANWAEEIAGKVERAIGIKMPSGQSPIVRIVVRPTSALLARRKPCEGGSASKGSVRSDGMPEDSESASGRVMTSQDLAGRQLVQRLLIYNYENVDREEAQEALCRLLLNAYVVARGKTDSFLPCWLSQGLAQNLYPSMRARNSELVLREWHDGQLPTLAELLRLAAFASSAKRLGASAPKEVKEDLQPDKSVCGLLFAWLQSMSDRRECFEKIFERLAAGETVSPEWLVTCIPACDSIVDLDEEWDNWILRQKRMIYRPGVVTSQVIDQLKARLLLYPGDFGVPLTGDFYQRIEFRDLIEQREASWISAFSRNKGASLRLLAVGRGDEFGHVVESYCRFLEALGKGKSRRGLEKLLDQADDALKLLEEKVHGK